MREMSPRTLVLDLARVADPRPLPVRALVAIGAWFELSEGALRVAVTRLAADGLLHSDERGSYRLGPAAAPRSRQAESWRLGDKRCRRWDGAFALVWLPRAPARGDRRQSERALGLLGFRPALAGTWVRPDNLTETFPELRERLAALGLEADAQLLRADELDPRTSARWLSELWPLAELSRTWRTARQRLERSTVRIPELPLERAAAETFVLGGEAIHAIATDPLLPDEVLDGTERRALHDAMLRYDELGRRTWRRALASIAAPARTTVARAGTEGARP